MDVLKDEYGNNFSLSDELFDALEAMGFSRSRLQQSSHWRELLLEMSWAATKTDPLMSAVMVDRAEILAELDASRSRIGSLELGARSHESIEQSLKRVQGKYEAEKLRAEEADAKLEKFKAATELERNLGQQVLQLADAGRKLVSIQKDLHLFRKAEPAE